MKTIRASLDLLAFQTLCAGKPADTTGTFQIQSDNGELEEDVNIELILQDVGYDVMLAAVQSPILETITKERLLEQDVLLKILDSMDTYGGSFVQQLSHMTRRGDHQNRLLCVMTWLKYFLEYKDRP